MPLYETNNHAPLARTADIATPLSGMITSTIEFAYEHRTRFGDAPVEGSPVFSDWPIRGEEPSSQRCTDIEEAHETAAGIYILSAAYFLVALSKLLCSEMQLFAYQVVSRSIVECAAKAWWLSDSEASADVRLARLYADKLNNVEEMVKAERLPRSDFDKRREELIQRASRSGIEPKYSTRNRLDGFGEVGRIRSTTLAGRFLGALGYEEGELWYRRFSAIAHATPYGLLDYYRMTDIPGSEFKELHPSLSIDDVRQAAILATQAYLGAIECDCYYMGWDSRRIREYRQQLLIQMTALSFE